MINLNPNFIDGQNVIRIIQSAYKSIRSNNCHYECKIVLFVGYSTYTSERYL